MTEPTEKIVAGIATVPSTPDTSPAKTDNRKRKTIYEKPEMFLLIIQMDNYSEAYTAPYTSPCVQKLLDVIDVARQSIFSVNGYKHTDGYRAVVDAFFCRVARRQTGGDSVTNHEELSFTIRSPLGGATVRYDMRDIIPQCELDLWEYHENVDGVLMFKDEVTWRGITILNYYG